MRTRWYGSIAIAMLVGSAFWAGCGDDDHTTIFSGNVSSISPALAAAPQPKDSKLALHWPKLTSEAYAQGACGSNGRLLFCIQTPDFGVCDRVSAGCEFEIETAIEREREAVTMTFVDDTNGNGVSDSGEPSSTVAQALRYCNGDRVRIEGADVNFTSGITAASVFKTRDRCNGTSATSTPNRTATAAAASTATAIASASGTATPTGSRTPSGTPTQYYAANSLNRPPSTMLAFLFSAGAVGLLVPRRRRRNGPR